MTDPDRPKRLFRKRRPADPTILHGQKIVTGGDLNEVFDDGGEVEYPAAYRRRIFHGVVLTMLVALIIAAVLVALAVARGDLTIPFLEPEAEEPIVCPTAVFNYPANEDVSANVYNSTNRGGLAGTVADQLDARGYNVLEIGNRSLNQNSSTAVVVSGPAGQAAAFNLQQNIPNSEYLEDERTDATVDVVLGRAFVDLNAEDAVSSERGRLSCPRLSPSPSPTPVPSVTAG